MYVYYDKISTLQAVPNSLEVDFLYDKFGLKNPRCENAAPQDILEQSVQNQA